MNQEQLQTDVYSIVTSRIITQLEAGTVPWQKPWTNAGMPQNLITHNPYRGINTWMLSSLGYEKNLFLTWHQIQELGASVNRGEKAHMVVFWKTLQKDTEAPEDKPKKIPLLRYYWVFNVAQCAKIPEALIPVIERPNAPIQSCEDIIKSMPLCPKIQHKDHEAYYHPIADFINMPKRKLFVNSEAYYGVLFHELTHSTGHSSRLNRKELVGSTGFGSEPYSMEELTAEIGACFLKSHTGIITEDLVNSSAYIKGWLEQLKGDKRFIFLASSAAQKAVDFITDKKAEETTTEGVETVQEVV